ncbi:FMN-dependent NADH-azoreductase [Leucothrix arctica]|uniref:FMN dependent NADH:quinone oxidoreductase n=1 Tax=Leucothrix arctica TaxID=1481894 RepID=A0A317C8M5_9GAMM|nr:NAD(P)H-dependent oxidoreductase [Leucothrix arctica]PWQ94848.1 FMN-dependent NADH-azoreductase [Leucothrix arctica]
MTNKTVLRIDSSMRTEGSISRELSDKVVSALGADQVVTNDLLLTPVPQIDEQWIGANFTPLEQRSAEQNEKLSLSNELVAQLDAADVIVIGVPVYNFGIPAALKAWVDNICRAGVTFQYTENGPQGLLVGKRAILVVASAGVPIDSPVDFATPYMRQLLSFIGITNVQIIEADNLMSDPKQIDQANLQIAQLQAA